MITVRIIPLIILAALNLIGLGIMMAKHGEKRSPHNFWVGLIGFLIEWSLIFWMIL